MHSLNVVLSGLFLSVPHSFMYFACKQSDQFARRFTWSFVEHSCGYLLILALYCPIWDRISILTREGCRFGKVSCFFLIFGGKNRRITDLESCLSRRFCNIVKKSEFSAALLLVLKWQISKKKKALSGCGSICHICQKGSKCVKEDLY